MLARLLHLRARLGARRHARMGTGAFRAKIYTKLVSQMMVYLLRPFLFRSFIIRCA